MKPADIGYLTEIPDRWREALDGATTLERLQEVLFEWRELFPDAYAARPKAKDLFENWREGLLMERGGSGKRKKFAGSLWAERWGAILIPSLMIEVSLVAEQFKVPWGCAYVRMQEAKEST